MGKSGKTLEEQLPELPSGYRWEFAVNNYHIRTAFIRPPGNVVFYYRDAVCMVTRLAHDTFVVKRGYISIDPGDPRIYSEMMLRQEIMTILAAHRLGI